MIKRTIIVAIGLIVFINIFSLSDYKTNSVTIESIRYLTGASDAGFADENFYKCVVDTYNEKNSTSLTTNDVLTDEQLSTIDELICKNRNVMDISGIEKLTNLTGLNLMENKLSDVDLSKNTSLMYVELSGNPDITSIDLSNNVNLKEIYFRNDSLKSIDLSNNVNLENLDLGANELTSISLVNNTKLKYVKLISNQLSSLDLSNNTNLIEFSAYNNSISSISLPDCDTLKILDLHGNKISNIDVSKYVNLEELSLSANELSSIDLSQNINLTELYISSNDLRSLDISNLENLTSLNAIFNDYENVVISHPEKITDLAIEADWIDDYNFSNFTNLNSLRIADYVIVPVYGTTFEVSNLSKYKTSELNYNEYIMYSDFNNRTSDYVYTSNSINSDLGSTLEYTICATNVSGYHNSCGNDLPGDVTFTFDDNVTASNLSSYSGIIYYEGYRVFRFMSLSSDKYVIDEENNTIDVGGDSDSNILSNIAVSFDDAVVNIQDDTLYVYYNDELLKSFNLLRVVNPKTGSLYIYLILGLLVISLGIIFYLRKRKKYISG